MGTIYRTVGNSTCREGLKRTEACPQMTRKRIDQNNSRAHDRAPIFPMDVCQTVMVEESSTVVPIQSRSKSGID